MTHGPADQGAAQLYDAVFHIGDLSYANGFLAQWDQFTARIEHIASKVPYMVARFVGLGPTTKFPATSLVDHSLNL